MKKLLWTCMGTATLICACNSKPSNEYTINGTTDLTDGEIIRLYYTVDNDSTVHDSCIVTQGKFSFKGTVDIPAEGGIWIGDMQKGPEKMRPIILEPGIMTVDLIGDNFYHAKISGSTLTAQKDSLDSINHIIYKQIGELQKKSEEVKNDTAAQSAIDRQYHDLYNKIKENNLNFVKSHPESYYTPIVLQFLKPDLSLDELKEIYASLSPEIQAADKATSDYLAAIEAVKPGNIAPEISGFNEKGEEVKLSDLKGKVVLLDFWATWCRPCRASLPHVKELYDKYKDKDFAILAVSIDRNENSWKEFITTKKSGLELYYNIFDKGHTNSNKYAVMFIPSKFIIDANGKIVGHFEEDKELDTKLAELLE